MKRTILYKGDLASLQSLSGGMAGDKSFYHKFQIGKKRIEDIGLKTCISDHALKGIEFISKNPDKRAKDPFIPTLKCTSEGLLEALARIIHFDYIEKLNLFLDSFSFWF